MGHVIGAQKRHERQPRKIPVPAKAENIRIQSGGTLLLFESELQGNPRANGGLVAERFVMEPQGNERFRDTPDRHSAATPGIRATPILHVSFIAVYKVAIIGVALGCI